MHDKKQYTSQLCGAIIRKGGKRGLNTLIILLETAATLMIKSGNAPLKESVAKIKEKNTQ